MHPIISFFYLDIRAYPLFVFLAIMTAVIGPCFLAKRAGLEVRRVFWLYVAMAASGLVGARVLHVLTSLPEYLKEPGLITNMSLQGQSFFGGISFAVITGILMSRRFKLDIWQMGDMGAPFLGLALMLARLGCFLNGCCFGIETDRPWGVRFPILSEAHRHQLNENIAGLFSVRPVHPTELYEAAVGFFIALFSFWLIRKKKPAGAAILFSGMAYSLFRFLIQPFRASSPTLSVSGWFYPGLYLLFFAICSSLLLYRLKYRRI